MSFIPLILLILSILHISRQENLNHHKKVVVISLLSAVMVFTIVSCIFDVISQNRWTEPLMQLWGGTIALLILLISPPFYRYLTNSQPLKQQAQSDNTTAITTGSSSAKKSTIKISDGEIFTMFTCLIPSGICQFISGMFHSATISSATTIGATTLMGIILISTLLGWFFFRGTPRQYLVSAAAITFTLFIGICFSGITVDYPLFEKIIVASLLALLVGSALVWFIRKPSIGAVLFLLVVHGFNLASTIFKTLLPASVLNPGLLIPGIVIISLLFTGISALTITGYVNYKKAMQSNA